MVHCEMWDKCIVVYGIRSIDSVLRMFKHQACWSSSGRLRNIYRHTSEIILHAYLAQLPMHTRNVHDICFISASNPSKVEYRKWLALKTWGCITKVSWNLQNSLSKFVYNRNRTSYENFKLYFFSCTQSRALGTLTKFWRAHETSVIHPPDALSIRNNRCIV